MHSGPEFQVPTFYLSFSSPSQKNRWGTISIFGFSNSNDLPSKKLLEMTFFGGVLSECGDDDMLSCGGLNVKKTGAKFQTIGFVWFLS